MALVESAGWRGVWRTLPRDVQAMVLTAALILSGGIGWLLVSPSAGPSGPPLLGTVDRPPPPAPKPALELPWWN
jgi:hypothetical protein